MKKVYAVTINYNNEKDTHGLLESFKKIKKDNFELSVVIVDNASKIPFHLTPWENSESIHLIRSEKNTGFTGGNNIGIKYALNKGAEYVLLINNDTTVDKDLITQLLNVLESDEKIGVVVPKIYFAKGHEFHKEKYNKNEQGKVFWYAGGFMDWKNIYSVHRGVDRVDHGQFDTKEEVNFATGCCMMVKKEVIEKIGIFDNKYFLYFEDADLSQRILRAGYSMVYVPTAVLWHINAGSSGSGSALHDYFLSRNRMFFGIKYAPLRSKIALVRESLRLLFSGRAMQKKGIMDFYLGRFGKGTYFNK